MHWKVVAILQTNPAWMILKFVTDNNIAISRPIGIWNDFMWLRHVREADNDDRDADNVEPKYTYRAAVEQTKTTKALDVH